MTRRSSSWRRHIEVAAFAAVFLMPVMNAGALDGKRANELTSLIRQDCGSCHGMTLKGGLGRPLTPDVLQDAMPEGLAQIILDGVPGTPMPAWRGLLSEEEAIWMAEQLQKGLPE